LTNKTKGFGVYKLGSDGKPKLVKDYPVAEGGEAWDTKVVGDKLIVSQRGAGLFVYSLSNPTKPKKVLHFTNPAASSLETGYLHKGLLLVGGSRGPKGVFMVASADGKKVHFTHVYNKAKSGVSDIFALGKYAFVSLNNGSFSVFDISNKKKVKLMTTVKGKGGWGKAITADKRYIYFSNWNGGLEIYDYKNVKTIKFLSMLKPTNNAVYQARVYAKDLVVLANAWGGVSLVDVKNKKDPLFIKNLQVKTGFYKTNALGIDLAGKFVIVADNATHVLSVFRIK
jgi:hypothetical protein